jgi:hypothetical protein
VYHAHYRPLTTPAAAALDLSSFLHRQIPRGIPTPSAILRHLGTALSPQTSSSSGGASVDHVAEAIVISLGDSAVSGVVGVKRMRELIGWWPEDEKNISGHKQSDILS